jgi:glycosyltransferase involved in cell wall biosynthesis
MCYPSAAAPTQGIFVQRRLAAIAKLTAVEVVAPQLWFPGYSGPPSPRGLSPDEAPPTRRPRMFYIPGLLKTFDSSFYARALEACLSADLRAKRVSLIDAHFEYPDSVGAWQVARRHGIPFVCTLRGKLVSQSRYWLRRRQIRKMLVDADAIISVSKSLADLAETVAGQKLDINIIPNGIDTSIYNHRGDCAAARKELGWSDQAKYIVSVGHLQELKGFHRLIAALPEVRRRTGDVRLILAGGSAGEPVYERYLQHRINEMNLREYVELPGRKTPPEIATLLNAADLFALASTSEGWCNAIAESLACGCPVVATDVGGNREIMNDWGLGRLAPPDDQSALINHVCACLAENWDRTKIAEYGGRRSWQQVARECVDVFRRITKID